MHNVDSNIYKKAGKYLVLGEIKRMCGKVNEKKTNEWTGTWMYNELFKKKKQKTLIDYQTKIHVHILKKKFPGLYHLP